MYVYHKHVLTMCADNSLVLCSNDYPSPICTFISPYPTLLYSTKLYSTLPHQTLLYSTLLISTLLYPTLPYPTLPYPTLPYPTLPYPTFWPYPYKSKSPP